MKFRLLAATLSTYLLSCSTLAATASDILHVMLQGSSAERLTVLVQKAGGEVTHDLHIINAVGAKMTQAQLDQVLESGLITRLIDDLADPSAREKKPDEDEDKCKVRGHIELDFNAQGVRWNLYNKKPEPARMQSLEFGWPTALGSIDSIFVGDKRVKPGLFQHISPGNIQIAFKASAAPVINDTAELKVNFKEPDEGSAPTLRQRDFTIDASFSGDCSTKLIPGYDNNDQDYYYNRVGGMEALHLQGVTGRGVTVAVLDSGLWQHPDLINDTDGRNRLLATYNAVTDTAGGPIVDESGHGTHMTSIIAHSGPTIREGQKTGSYKGVAPDANLVAVKLLDREGLAHLLEITRAVQWVVDNRDKYQIKVLNLSFSQDPQWPYWEDPVNQAVMRAWAAGITVVAAAGNDGPKPATIGSPGNLPYIITVGAVTDSWTPETRDDDYIPDFSSRGPTPSGHVKPDVVALGGHITGLTYPDSAMAQEQPEDLLGSGELVSTGSSQASALVSGIVALLLQLDPDLTPDEVKCMLITSAEPAINSDGLLAYSPFQQGFGYINAVRAVTLGQPECGGTDWDINADISGSEHFYGPAIEAQDGSPSLPGLENMVSSEPSEKGLSETRKWGVKDHVERVKLNPPPGSPTGKDPFNWQDLYLQEKEAIESLSRPSKSTP